MNPVPMSAHSSLTPPLPVLPLEISPLLDLSLLRRLKPTTHVVHQLATGRTFGCVGITGSGTAKIGHFVICLLSMHFAASKTGEMFLIAAGSTIAGSHFAAPEHRSIIFS